MRLGYLIEGESLPDVDLDMSFADCVEKVSGVGAEGVDVSIVQEGRWPGQEQAPLFPRRPAL